MLWQIRLKSLCKYKMISREIDCDFDQQLLLHSQTVIHHLVSDYRCLLHTETAEWVIYADTTKGNS